MCPWRHGPALRAGSHLDLRGAAHPPRDHHDCLSVHHQQHLSGDVPLHLPLRAVPKGNAELDWVLDPAVLQRFRLNLPVVLVPGPGGVLPALQKRAVLF